MSPNLSPSRCSSDPNLARRGCQAESVTDTTASRIRREPPPLRVVEVVQRDEITTRMLRLTFEGDGLRELVAPEPASSVRLLVPSPGADELVLPEWNGNEFLLPGGERPALRTFTPLRFDAETGRIELEVVRHPGGVVSGWAETAGPGDRAAISGPGRGWELDRSVGTLHLLGDETALPAIGQLIELTDPSVAITVDIEVETDEAIQRLPGRTGVEAAWHVRGADDAPGATLVRAATSITDVDADVHIWAAGEAASMQAIRKHCFDALGLSRSQTTIRGYWKPARG